MEFPIHLDTKLTGLLIRPQPITLKILPIMLLSSAQNYSLCSILRPSPFTDYVVLLFLMAALA